MRLKGGGMERERETERKGEIERGSKNDVQLMHKLK